MIARKFGIITRRIASKHAIAVSSSEPQSSLGENAGASCCVITAVNEAIGGGAETASSASGAKIGNGFVHIPHGANEIAGTAAPAFLALGGTIGSYWNAVRNRALRKDLESISADIEAIDEEGLHKADQIEIARELAKERGEAAKFMEHTAGWRAVAVSGVIALSAIPGLAVLAPVGLFGSAVNAVSHGRREWKQWKKARAAVRTIKAELREFHEYSVDESRRNAKIKGFERFYIRYIRNHTSTSSNTLREKILPAASGWTIRSDAPPEPPQKAKGVFFQKDCIVDSDRKTILESVHYDGSHRLTDKEGFFLGYVSAKHDGRVHRAHEWINQDNLREGAALREWLRHYRKERKLRLKNLACWTAYGVGSAALCAFTLAGLVGATIASHGAAVPVFLGSLKVATLSVGCAGMALGVAGALRYNSRLNGPKYTPSFPRSMSDLIRLRGKTARERTMETAGGKVKLGDHQENAAKDLIHETEMPDLIRNTNTARENIEKTRSYRHGAISGMKLHKRMLYNLGALALGIAPILTLGIISQTCATWQRRWKERGVSWFGGRDGELLSTLDIPIVEVEGKNESSKAKSRESVKKKADFHCSISSWVRDSDDMRKSVMMAYDGMSHLLVKRFLSENFITGRKKMPEEYRDIFIHPDDKKRKIIFTHGYKLADDQGKRVTRQFQEDVVTLDNLQGCCYGNSIGKGVLEDMLDMDDARGDGRRPLRDSGLLQNAAIQYAAFSRENVSREKLARTAQMGVIRLRQKQHARKNPGITR